MIIPQQIINFMVAVDATIDKYFNVADWKIECYGPCIAFRIMALRVRN